jgi:hypothetical protein
MSLKILRLSTTHVDRHNERMSVEALKSMVTQSNENIIPLGIEHDPRKSPVGRIIQTKLVELDDGEYAIDGIAEMFDSSIDELSNVGNRSIPIRDYSNKGLQIITDRNFRDEDSKEHLLELSKILKNAHIEEEIKKSLDPITVLTIGGSFILGAIASGFFGEIGADGFRALKNILAKLFVKKSSGQEKLLHLEFTVSNGIKSINIEIILTDPTQDEINSVLDTGLNQLDILVAEHFENEMDFARIVYNYGADKFELNYSVLKSGIPLKRGVNNR